MKTHEHDRAKPHHSPMTIILGGVTHEAQMRDGSKEEVKVRQLPIRLIEKWATAQGDEAALVELYCDKEEGWDDKLLPESHVAIMKIGEDLNLPIFGRWAESRSLAIGRLTEVRQKMSAQISDSATSSSTAAASSE